MKKTVIAFFGVLIAAAVVGGSLLIWGRPKVAVSAVRKTVLEERVKGTGKVDLLGSVEVRSPLSARVAEVCVEEGEKVKEGQVLLRFEGTEVLFQLREAEAALQQARTQVERAVSAKEVAVQEVAAARLRLDQAEREKERMEFLFEQGAVSQKEYEDARDQAELAAAEVAQVEAGLRESEKAVAEAQAALRVALAEVDYWKEKSRQLVLVSPRSGTVVRREVDPGAFVNEGDLLLEIGDPLSLELELLVTPQDLPQVKIGDQVEIRPLVGAFPAATGEVVQILPHGEVVTSSLGVEEAKGVVKVRFTENAELFRPGYKVRGEVITSRRSGVLTVPEEAVLSTSGGEFVYVVDEKGCLEKRKVVLGEHKEGIVEVLGGLKEGEKVVVKPAKSLKPGQKVRVNST